MESVFAWFSGCALVEVGAINWLIIDINNCGLLFGCWTLLGGHSSILRWGNALIAEWIKCLLLLNQWRSGNFHMGVVLLVVDWFSHFQELTWSDLLFLTLLALLSMKRKTINWCLEHSLGGNWSHSWREHVVGLEWSVRGIVVASNSKDAALRLWFARDWRENRWNLVFVESALGFIVLFLWLGLDLVLFIKTWSLLCSSGHWAEQIFECLVNGIWSELLGLFLSWCWLCSFVPVEWWSLLVLTEDCRRVGSRCVRKLSWTSDLVLSQNNWSNDWARLLQWVLR